MAQNWLTAARVSAVAVTAAATITASLLGKESEKDKQRQLETRRLALDGPRKSIKDKLSHVAFKLRAVRKEEDQSFGNRKAELDDMETLAKRIEKFSESRLASNSQAVQEIFDVTAEARGRQSEAGQQESPGTEPATPAGKGHRRPGNTLPRTKPKPTGIESTREWER